MLRVSRSMESDLYAVVFARLSFFGHCGFTSSTCSSCIPSPGHCRVRSSRTRHAARRIRAEEQPTRVSRSDGRIPEGDDLFSAPVGAVARPLSRFHSPRLMHGPRVVCLQNSICERRARGSARVNSVDNPLASFLRRLGKTTRGTRRSF